MCDYCYEDTPEIEAAWEAAGNGYLDDQIGSVDEMGWYGLYGSVIIWQDEYGFKDGVVYDSLEEAIAAWEVTVRDLTEEDE